MNTLELEENFREVRERIERASGGREITLLAATKTVDAETINYAAKNLGLTDIGENRVQELLDKYDSLDLDGVKLHFIGTLQTNKVKYIIDKVALIHSVDSEKLAAEIDRQAKKHGIVMDILCEVNIGEEKNKSGVMPDSVGEFVNSLMKYQNIRVRGLMTMAPVCTDKNEYKNYFKKTYKMFLDIFGEKGFNIKNAILSMGMSDSYETAAECGSTMVRVGTALFGKRIYTK